MALILVLALTMGAAAQETPAGRWKAEFSDPAEKGHWPKMFSEAILDLKIEGHKVTGTALMGGWPGLAPIIEGVVSGDHFIFTTLGQRTSTSGFPKMTFAGTFQGKEMKLTMTWGWVDGRDEGLTRDLKMKGHKIAD